MTDPAQLEIVFRTIIAEAASEGPEGMAAVASVIVNRAKLATAYKIAHNRDHALYGDGTLAGACLVPYAFSCWNGKALEIARQALNGLLPDSTNGATHYANLSLASPEWAKGAKMAAAIGHHTFFKDVP